jgi:uncharacterized membrane protein
VVIVRVVGAVVIVRVIIARAIEGRADQLAIREAFLIRGLFGWYGVERIFQIAPPARRAGRITTTLEPVLVGPEV